MNESVHISKRRSELNTSIHVQPSLRQISPYLSLDLDLGNFALSNTRNQYTRSVPVPPPIFLITPFLLCALFEGWDTAGIPQ